MQKISLAAVARQQLDRAAAAGSGHTAATVYGGHEKVLRQTVIGMSQVPAWRSMKARARPPSRCSTAGSA
jgi:hypothetical protein